MRKWNERESLDSFLLSGISLCYFWTLAALYVQFPGLFGEDGLQPMQLHEGLREEQQGTPWVDRNRAFLFVKPVAEMAGSVDLACEGLMLAGMAAALCNVIVAKGHSVVCCVVQWISYLAIQQAGAPFLSFQWDILLHEGGLLAVLHVSGLAWTATLWAFRFLFFKLMFMSGIVKVQSNCPTWLDLSALEYHFQTQPIPTPLAWYASLFTPKPIMRLSVWATLVFEIPATVLILAPFHAPRVLAGLAIILLQLLICLTGNYTCFNFITACLCIPLFMEDNVTLSWIESSVQRKVALGLLSFLVIICYSFAVMFQVVWDIGSREFPIRLTQSPQELQEHLKIFLPFVALFEIVLLTDAIACDMFSSFKTKGVAKTVGCFVVAGLSAFLVVISLVPLFTLDKSMLYSLPNPVLEAYQTTAPTGGLVYPYGLFRRMTGVGTNGEIARPEVILEMQSSESQTWKEIEFYHKPVRLDEPLRFIVPNQPRLDWNMWFAALTEYQGAPWIIHLASKLLHNSSAVLALLPPMESPPERIRAKLYHYNFTRSWKSGNWWHRNFIKEYFPPFGRDDENVKKFLNNFGWTSTQKKLAMSPPPWRPMLQKVLPLTVSTEFNVALLAVIVTSHFVRQRSR